MDEMLTFYQWPARMSVAIFFELELDIDGFLFVLLKKRIEKFCNLYPEIIKRSIQDIRWVNTSSIKWNGFDEKTISETNQSAKTYLHDWRKANKPKQTRFSVKIEEISNAAKDL